MREMRMEKRNKKEKGRDGGRQPDDERQREAGDDHKNETRCCLYLVSSEPLRCYRFAERALRVHLRTSKCPFVSHSLLSGNVTDPCRLQDLD